MPTLYRLHHMEVGPEVASRLLDKLTLFIAARRSAEVVTWFVKRDGLYWDLGEWVAKRSRAAEFVRLGAARKVAQINGARVVRLVPKVAIPPPRRVPPIPKRSRFEVGHFARVTNTKVTFEVLDVSEDGETIGGHQDGHRSIARFCHRVPRPRKKKT